jgi:hypothetical protein
MPPLAPPGPPSGHPHVPFIPATVDSARRGAQAACGRGAGRRRRTECSRRVGAVWGLWRVCGVQSACVERRRAAVESAEASRCRVVAVRNQRRGPRQHARAASGQPGAAAHAGQRRRARRDTANILNNGD